MDVIFLFKLAVVPSLIAGITLAGRRWGPTVAGWLSAFPVVAGPILAFMAIEQGAAFTTKAATATLSAVLAILAFGIAYAWAATRHRWPISLATGFVGYALAVAGLNAGAPTLPASVPLVLGALLLAPRLYPTAPAAPTEPTAPPAAQAAAAAPGKPTQDMPLRMLAGALLVWTVTHFAATMGPGLSGVFAMFPVMGSVLVVFSHRQSGGTHAIQLLRGMVLGYYAFASFCVVLTLALPTMRVAPAFACAFGTALLIQTATRFGWLHHQRRKPDALMPAR